MAKKIKWSSGDIFAIQLKNSKYSVGQVLDLRWPNCVRCAFYDEIYLSIESINVNLSCNGINLISLIEVTREKLDYGNWQIVGNKHISIPLEMFPNEQFRHNGWIGAITHDAELAEDFLNAFYGLIPWDDWHNPNYLDSYLIDISKKPSNLLLKNLPLKD